MTTSKLRLTVASLEDHVSPGSFAIKLKKSQLSVVNPEIWSEWKDDPGFKSFVEIKVIVIFLVLDYTA